MKTETQIRDEIVRLNIERGETTVKRRSLHQVDLLSGEGNELMARENYLLGQMAALTWLLEDGNTSE